MAGVVLASPSSPGGSLAGFGPPQIINIGATGNQYILPRGTWWVDCSPANSSCIMIMTGVTNLPGGWPSPWVLIPNAGKALVVSDGLNVALSGTGNANIMQVYTS